MTDSTQATAARSRLPRRLGLWTLVLTWAGVIFWFSAKPGSEIPGRFADVGHLGEYFIFGVLLYFALCTDIPRERAASIAIIAASCYGITDEFHQHFVVMRTPDAIDWGMDTVGAAVGALVGLGLTARRRAATWSRHTTEP